jgi:hypothetical protein
MKRCIGNMSRAPYLLVIRDFCHVEKDLPEIYNFISKCSTKVSHLGEDGIYS